MTKTFLFELGLEEMPAHVVTAAEKQFAQKVAAFLDDQKLTHGKIEQFSTPRRLSLLIHDLADKQADQDLEMKGPAQKIAQDAAGNWSKAAQGFARGQGASVESIFFQDFKGTPYAYVKKHIAGQSAASVLPGLTTVISDLTFPTRMKWNKFNFEFIRPLHWIVALLDNQILDFKFLNLQAGNQTRGHRFLGGPITLAQASDYPTALEQEFVIADAHQRKAEIKKQIQQLASQHQWQINLDPDLLEEVTNLVEFPTAFAGQFDPKYLQIPEEVLITSMKDNQRYFYVRDQEGKLAPYFIGVRNGNQNDLNNVIAGNEKVLVARLEDAAFFFAEDQKRSLQDYVSQLENVTFHDKIGSMSAKMARTKVIAQLLAQKLKLDGSTTADVLRAAEIYKFDLVTDMVGEFSELQGVMGEKYALIFGEKPTVAQAIREHYLPTAAEGDLPQSRTGEILSLADKLESLMSFFAVDLLPTGSNDPYGLRRQAYGLIRILQAQNWHLDLQELQTEISAAYQAAQLPGNFDYQKHQAELTTFFQDRVRQFLAPRNINHGVIEAVVANSKVDPVTMLTLAQSIQAAQETAVYKPSMEALTRVLHLTQQNQTADLPQAVDSGLFVDSTETDLYQAVQKLQEQFSQLEAPDRFAALIALQPTITAYFDANMILDSDLKIRANRLKQLQLLAQLINSLGDLNQLVIK
ncbi:glycine--tRNA ligase subunit beta [Lactobacillus sp. DCY120]|uniref:Glycine--tRNA ligase beta subunit n=1 Tax=Bombilactobacillus apium TaxID=2675299 RepID=A0A850R4R5_9LACO|nr:glycine--tRNA ligase subunit beta [Bombilactobacillus apium]NVY95837.1 glycine--tRNA ligase subunit beta [Bombilactobacillus apium]